MQRRIVHAMLGLLALVVSAGALASPFPRLDQFGRSLDLSPAQQVQFDAAVAATQRTVVAAVMAGVQMKAQVQAEFAKARPDLDALAKLKDATEETLRPLHLAARAEWLKLYAMLSDEQAALVKEHVHETFDHLEALHQFVMRLLLGKAGTAG
jgi:periplasmic protein CpxP/Spy